MSTATLVRSTKGLVSFGTIPVNYGRSFEEMIAAGGFDSINHYITPQNFPIEGRGGIVFEAALVQYEGVISAEDAVDDMQAENWHPARFEQLLSFGENFPRKQLEYPIIGLGSVAVINVGLSTDKFVPALAYNGSGRGLTTVSWDGNLAGNCRYLAVRRIGKK